MAKSEHKHTWLDQMFIFPDTPGEYEFDHPYLVQYCACGDRRTKSMSTDEIRLVRTHEGLPPLSEEEGGKT